MAHAWAEELDIGTGVMPVINRETPDVGVTGLGDERTAADSSITTCKSLVLLVTFE